MSKIQFWKQFTTNPSIKNEDESCIRYVKDTILKAIYNEIKNLSSSLPAVFDMSKIQFWKQFTTKTIKLCYNNRCIRYVKDTILKAIYNTMIGIEIRILAVFDMSKIQFWKQFTTYLYPYLVVLLLYSICQRYNFESNLQLPHHNRYTQKCCIRYVKDTILKAIYNY